MVHPAGGVSQVQREQADDLQQWYTRQEESRKSKESKPMISNNGTHGRMSFSSPKRASQRWYTRQEQFLKSKESKPMISDNGTLGS